MRSYYGFQLPADFGVASGYEEGALRTIGQ
jgi:hypothetical protein